MGMTESSVLRKVQVPMRVAADARRHPVVGRRGSPPPRWPPSSAGAGSALHRRRLRRARLRPGVRRVVLVAGLVCLRGDLHLLLRSPCRRASAGEGAAGVGSASAASVRAEQVVGA
jgi:hypothetical protein